MIYCDVKNQSTIFHLISKYQPDFIFHLAAQTIVPTAKINPFETLTTNILGTINILEATRLFDNIKAVLIASSDKAYGISPNLPYLESNRLEGRYPYDVSKSSADLISQMYSFTYKIPIIITRCSNIFGPGDLHFSRIIPGIMRALSTNQPLDIRSDGTPIREYIYVKDVVYGYLALVENINKTVGEAYNISSEIKFSVLELVNKISEILNKKLKVNILNIAESEIQEQWLSSKKIFEATGWKPVFSFEESIKVTYEWYKNHFFK